MAMDEETRQGLRLGGLLALAHHPLCAPFGGDVLRVGTIRLCVGCLATWPLFLVTLVAIPLSGWWTSPPEMLALGLLLGLPQAIVAARGSPRLWSIAAKAVGAPGLALVVLAILLFPGPAWQRLLLASVGTLGLGLLLGLRLRRMLARCGACVWRRRWADCPGMLRHQEGWRDPPPVRVQAGEAAAVQPWTATAKAAEAAGPPRGNALEQA